MPSTTMLATARAYEIQTELGGGYRGTATNALTKEHLRSEVCQTMEQARYAAKMFVFTWAEDRNMVTGSYRNTPSSWKMNYFIRSDEV